MKRRLLMVLAVLLLSFGVSQAADSVYIAVYDVAGDSLLSPGDTIYLADTAGNPLSYQFLIALENDGILGGLSLGFRIYSVDGATWNWDAQPDGLPSDGLAAFTVDTTSRLHPHEDVLDMTGLLVTEQDVDGQLDDSVTLGGVALWEGLPIGPMETMIAGHFTPSGVQAGETKEMCFDSAFIPPAGEWTYADLGGITRAPAMGPGICFPVNAGGKAADDGEGAVPYSYSLDQNYPNPFNPVTVFSYSVARKTHVNIAVFNILGQTVATLVDEDVEAGPHKVVWEGIDDNGNPAASGIYFYKMYTGSYVETRKMVLMR